MTNVVSPTLFLVFAVVFTHGCDSQHDGRRSEAAAVSTERLGSVPRSPWIQGRDGGSSGLAFGRSIWVFGDTVLNEPDGTGTQWHTNSFAQTEIDQWLATGFTTPTDAAGAPNFFVDLTADEKAWDAQHAAEACETPPCSTRWALWPGAPVYDEASRTAWILYGLYNDHQPSGIGIASWKGLDQPVQRHRIGDSWLLFPSHELEWANAPLAHDGYLYAFACPRDDWDHTCRLGRAPLESPDDRTTWRYFDGETWSPVSSRAATLFNGAPIMSASFVAAIDRWLVIYSEPFSEDIVLRSAPDLVGPWSAPAVLFAEHGEPPYDVVHHPELEQDGGLVQYVTYSQPTSNGWFGAEHVLWRVVLEPQ